MRFQLTHVFDAPIDEVDRVARSDRFQLELQHLPGVGSRKVIARIENPDGTVHRTTRYSLGRQLPPGVVKALGSTATWDEVAVYDPALNGWTFTINVQFMPSRFDIKGSYRFEPASDTTTTRIVDVDLKVKIPLVGSRVENEIKNGLTETFETEARLLEQYLR